MAPLIGHIILLYLICTKILSWRNIEQYKPIFCIYWEIICMPCVLSLFHELYYIYWFIDRESSFHPCDKSLLIMTNDIFDMLLGFIWQCFIEKFASAFISHNGESISFLVMHCLWNHIKTSLGKWKCSCLPVIYFHLFS